MRHLFYSLAMFVAISTATSAAHAETTDTLVNISPTGALQFAHLTNAVLANVTLPDPAVATQWLAPLKGQRLRYDTLDNDRYGRAQIILYSGDTQLTVQQQMVRQGLAVSYTTVKASDAPDWSNDEAIARQAHRGYWAQSEHFLTPETAEKAIGQFGVVRGAITNSYRARDAYYLNFGARWQDDFSIKIPHKNWRALADTIDRIEQQLPAPSNPKIKRRLADPAHPVIVQVRGTLISENGPMIVVTRPDQLEIIRNAKPKP